MSATDACSRCSISSSMSANSHPRRRASARPTLDLPPPMKPTRYTLSLFTRLYSRNESAKRVEESGIRDDDRISADDLRRRPAGKRGNRELHRHAVVASGVGGARADGRPSGLAGDEAVRTFVGGDAERAQPGDKRGDAVGFLHTQLRGAADADFRAVTGKRGDRRKFVNQTRDVFRSDVDAADAVAFDDDRASRLAGRARLPRDRHLRAESPQDVGERRPG